MQTIILALCLIFTANAFTNCKIAFRFDQLQEFDRTSTQTAVLQVFSDENVPVTIAPLSQYFGLDVDPNSALTPFIKNLFSNGKPIELATGSPNLDSLVGKTFTEQSNIIKSSRDRLATIITNNPREIETLVPPLYLFDQLTLDVLRSLGMDTLSASFEPTCSPCDSHNFYTLPSDIGVISSINHAPATVFTSTKPGNGTLKPLDSILSALNASLTAYGYAVIALHYDEHSAGLNQPPSTSAISQLRTLLQTVKTPTYNCNLRLIQDMDLPVVSTPATPLPPTPSSVPVTVPVTAPNVLIPIPTSAGSAISPMLILVGLLALLFW